MEAVRLSVCSKMIEADSEQAMVLVERAVPWVRRVRGDQESEVDKQSIVYPAQYTSRPVYAALSYALPGRTPSCTRYI